MKFEIFKVGTHTSSNGITKEYTLDHLNQIAQNHSEPTPIVVGHPKDNSPAFGWIKKLFVKGESLFAEAADLVPEFIDLLKQKIYKNRSVSLKQNEDGTLSLNHVGFLGGALPAVKGLEELNLNADDIDEILFEFSEIELEEKEPSKKNKTKSKDVSADFIEVLENLKSQISDLKSDFSNALQTVKGSVDVSGIQAKIEELNLKLDSAYFQRNILDKLQMDNLTPAIKIKVLNILSYFESLDFSDTEQSKVLSDFQELVDLIQPFQTDEVIKKVSLLKRGTEGGLEFANMNVDKASLKIYEDANALAEEEEISFSEAVNKIISINSNKA